MRNGGQDVNLKTTTDFLTGKITKGKPKLLSYSSHNVMDSDSNIRLSILGLPISLNYVLLSIDTFLLYHILL